MLKACPVVGKAKSAAICEAFIAGAPPDAKGFVFFGVNETNRQEWINAKTGGLDFYYCDNAFFDQTRDRYFRVARNRVQHHGYGTGDDARLAAIGITLKPWREAGSHIVVCTQSDVFMGHVARYKGDWLRDVRQRLEPWPLRVRPWSAVKLKIGLTLCEDLRGAHALVTWSSSAAITAVIEGVPIVCMGQSAAMPMSGKLDQIDALPMLPDDVRLSWLAVLANHEWTLDEMRAGVAWETLNA